MADVAAAVGTGRKSTVGFSDNSGTGAGTDGADGGGTGADTGGTDGATGRGGGSGVAAGIDGATGRGGGNSSIGAGFGPADAVVGVVAKAGREGTAVAAVASADLVARASAGFAVAADSMSAVGEGELALSGRLAANSLSFAANSSSKATCRRVLWFTAIINTSCPSVFTTHKKATKISTARAICSSRIGRPPWLAKPQH